MESSQEPPLTAPYASRTDIRRAVHNITRRVLLQHLAQHRSGEGAATVGIRLTKVQRQSVVQQSHLLEGILYRRAFSLEEYQDLSTLEERVFSAGRGVYLTRQLREMERASCQQQALNGDAAVRAEGESEESMRRTAHPKAVQPLDETAQRSESFDLNRAEEDS